MLNSALIEVKQSFSRQALWRFRQLLETSKTHFSGVEIYQMINGQFSHQIPEIAFRNQLHVIFAAGAKNTETAS